MNHRLRLLSGSIIGALNVAYGYTTTKNAAEIRDLNRCSLRSPWRAFAMR